MKWGFHAGTVNDARSARKCQVIGCRLRGSLRRPSGKIVEGVHSHKGKQSEWTKESDIDLLFSCACGQTKRSFACSSGYQSLQKYGPREQAKGTHNDLLGPSWIQNWKQALGKHDEHETKDCEVREMHRETLDIHEYRPSRSAIQKCNTRKTGLRRS